MTPPTRPLREEEPRMEIDLMKALKASLHHDGQPRQCDNPECGLVDTLGVVVVGHKHHCGGTWQLTAPSLPRNDQQHVPVTTTREVMAMESEALMYVANYTIARANSQPALDAIRRLATLARRATPAPSDTDLRWAIMHDPLTAAAYHHGRQSLAGETEPPRQFSTPDCPMHGEACMGSDCCCRDKHPYRSRDGERAPDGETREEPSDDAPHLTLPYDQLENAYHAQVAHTDFVRSEYQKRVATLESALLTAHEDRAKAEGEREAVRAPVRWWESAGLRAPFTPTGEGGNDGIVRDGRGGFVADTRGYEARADVIAELLNRAALQGGTP